AAHRAGRADALARTTAAYRIHRGMYAGGGPPGQPPGGISPDSYAAMTSWARSRRPSLARIRLTWVLAVAGLTTSRPAISALDRPCATSTSTSRSRPVSAPASRASRPGSPPRKPRAGPAQTGPGDEVGHQVAVGRRGEQRLPGGDDPDRREQ